MDDAGGAPPSLPPDAVATTVEELPAGFWGDDAGADGHAAPTATPEHEGPVGAATPDPRPASARVPDAPPRPPGRGPPPAVAGLQGLPLLEAVFPGRVLKIERPDPVADPGAGATDADAATALGDVVPDPDATHDADAPFDEALPLLDPLRRDS